METMSPQLCDAIKGTNLVVVVSVTSVVIGLDARGALPVELAVVSNR